MTKKELTIYIPAVLIILILALIPFHAFLTVWLNSLIGHYTVLRLWKEYLLATCLLFASYFLITDKRIRQFFYHSWLIQAILAFFVIELIWGVVAIVHGSINAKALFYGWLSDCRYFIFFLVTLVIAKKTTLLNSKAIKLVIWPAVIVIVFGLLEIFVLPKNFLAHCGYSLKTIPPYQTINNNSRYVRIISTLRGSDPLGAYLLIPLSLATVLLIRKRKVWQMVTLVLAGLVVMFFSYSRSAWLGLIISLSLAVYWGLKSITIRRYLLYGGIALVLVLVAGLILERNSTRVQNIVFHTQTHSLSPVSSDQGHASALKTGLRQLAKEPLGRGPGTSGPASIYNTHQSRITENYYLEIGQEVGWLGLLVFLAINGLIVLSLWARRTDTLSLAVLVSFLGLIVCNMLLPAWTDDTLSYLWWGLAAIAIASVPRNSKSPQAIL